MLSGLVLPTISSLDSRELRLRDLAIRNSSWPDLTPLTAGSYSSRAAATHFGGVWDGGHPQAFKLVMTFCRHVHAGFRLAGSRDAIYRSERQAFDSETAIRRQKDGLAMALVRVNLLARGAARTPCVDDA